METFGLTFTVDAKKRFSAFLFLSLSILYKTFFVFPPFFCKNGKRYINIT